MINLNIQKCYLVLKLYIIIIALVEKEEKVMNNNETKGFMRCSYCGEIYYADKELLNKENSLFVCKRCGKEFDIPFFAYCKNCNKIVGLDNSSAFSEIFNGMVNHVKQPWSLLGFIPRMIDDIPSANGWGICPFCDSRYIRCPRCSLLVEIKGKMDVNDIIRCLNCGQKMRQP